MPKKDERENVKQEATSLQIAPQVSIALFLRSHLFYCRILITSEYEK